MPHQQRKNLQRCFALGQQTLDQGKGPTRLTPGHRIADLKDILGTRAADNGLHVRYVDQPLRTQIELQLAQFRSNLLQIGTDQRTEKRQSIFGDGIIVGRQLLADKCRQLVFIQRLEFDDLPAFFEHLEKFSTTVDFFSGQQQAGFGSRMLQIVQQTILNSDRQLLDVFHQNQAPGGKDRKRECRGEDIFGKGFLCRELVVIEVRGAVAEHGGLDPADGLLHQISLLPVNQQQFGNLLLAQRTLKFRGSHAAT
jgi:hypothetical protein